MKRPARPVPEGIRITKVGLWYVLITLVVAIAATNTGNNALYLVWSVMLAVLVVSGVVSRQNVRGLAVAGRSACRRAVRQHPGRLGRRP